MVLTIFSNNAHAAERAAADIKLSDYPYVAALARASILADQPIAPTTQKIIYQFESGVPIENQNEIKEGGDNFISRFGNILNYSGTPITVITFSTSPGGLALARAFDPVDVKFQGTIESFLLQSGKGGLSFADKRLVFLGGPLVQSSESYLPIFQQLLTHELMHEVQASINSGTNRCIPVWLCEGGAQIMYAAMSVYQGKDTWAGGREHFSHIQDNRTLADLKIMEGYGSGSAPYSTGAILSEYLIAWGGFSNSLLVQQISYKTQNPDTMSGFRQAFQIVYGQSLDDFYIHALPYINYVAANWKSTSATSPEAVALIIDRLGAVKAAEVVAAAATKAAAEKAVVDKAAVDKAAVDKAAIELKAKQEAEAKAAADKVAADLKAKQEAEARAAAVKKKTTITCVKGKLTKKVTAVKPFCPAGFKKK
jgi:hypothetical protein